MHLYRDGTVWAISYRIATPYDCAILALLRTTTDLTVVKPCDTEQREDIVFTSITSPSSFREVLLRRSDPFNT